MVTPDYSLSAAPRPVGRSMADAGRMQDIAMRRMRSRGDVEGAAKLAQSQAWLDARFLGRNPAAVMPAMPAAAAAPAAAPMMPAMPTGGKLVPGRSAGSMVWQPASGGNEEGRMTNGQTAAPAMPMPQPDAMPMPAPMPQPMPVPLAEMQGTNPLTGMPINDRPPMLPAGTLAQNAMGFPGLAAPPPGMYGEAAPLVSSLPIPGTNQVMPMIQGQPKGAPIERTKTAEAPKIPEGIQYEKDAMGKIIGGVYPTYNEQGKLVMRRIDLDGDGVVSPAEQSAAMQAAGQTPGGVRFSRVQ